MNQTTTSGQRRLKRSHNPGWLGLWISAVPLICCVYVFTIPGNGLGLMLHPFGAAIVISYPVGIVAGLLLCLRGLMRKDSRFPATVGLTMLAIACAIPFATGHLG